MAALAKNAPIDVAGARRITDRRCTIGNHTGSNCEISQRPSILSRVTRTLDAVLVGALWPTVTVWSTNRRTTACVGVADDDAAAGTVATAATCFCFAPGITT